MNKTKWRPADIKELKDMFDKDYPDERIAIALNMPISSIKNKRRKLGLLRRQHIEWTDEKVKFITDLHAKRHTMTEIASAFSDKFQPTDKNSIIGKLHRLGKSERNVTVKIQTNKIKPLEIITQEGGILLLDATYSQCRYPFSTGAKMRVCGKDRVSGCSYCQEHRELCHIPIKSRKETDASKAKHKERFFDENTVI
jgi:hypothetical protein